MDTVGYNELSWDTRFFGFTVGTVNAFEQSPNEVQLQLASIVKSPPCRLLYIHVDPEDAITQEYVTKLGARLVDKRVVFRKYTLVRHSTTSFKVGPHVEVYVEQESNELNELAFLAGMYSRFRTDPNFGDTVFQRLYTQWIKRSLSGAIADKVLITRDQRNLPASLITLTFNNGIGSIGLLAVRSDQQGKGLGLMLVNHALAQFSHKLCTTAEVVTQSTNTAACKLYEKSGFIPVWSSFTYHLWLPVSSSLNNMKI